MRASTLFVRVQRQKDEGELGKGAPKYDLSNHESTLAVWPLTFTQFSFDVWPSLTKNFSNSSSDVTLPSLSASTPVLLSDMSSSEADDDDASADDDGAGSSRLFELLVADSHLDATSARGDFLALERVSFFSDFWGKR
jgi:hypothetical protein